MHGLVKAANTYAPSKGKFSSWAAPIIRNFLGHLNFHQGVQRDHEVVSLDAPIGGDGEGSDDATMADRIGGSVDPEIGRGMSQSTAAQIVDDELANIPEPKRSMVRRWMAGESYRDLQADYGMSFTMIMHHVKGELSKIKQSLAAKGILSMSDIWPESLETDSNGKFIYECLLTHVTVGLALQQLQEKDLRTKLSA
jgi:DNA-directed RNA polymerase specialized sigma24 family protein